MACVLLYGCSRQYAENAIVDSFSRCRTSPQLVMGSLKRKRIGVRLSATLQHVTYVDTTVFFFIEARYCFCHFKSDICAPCKL